MGFGRWELILLSVAHFPGHVTEFLGGGELILPSAAHFLNSVLGFGAAGTVIPLRRPFFRLEQRKLGC